MTYKERRRFKRLPIPENTVVVDSKGHMLGRVGLAGGDGMQLEEISAEGEHQLQPGKIVRITIEEPAIGAHHTVDVKVLYRKGRTAGLQFVTGAGAN